MSIVDAKRVKLGMLNHTKAYDDDTFVAHFKKRNARDIIVMDATGKPLRSTITQRRTFVYAALLKPLAAMARNVVRDLDPANDATFMRLRSETHEVHMSLHQDFIIVVMQKLRQKK